MPFIGGIPSIQPTGNFALPATYVNPIGTTTYGDYNFSKGFSYNVATRIGDCGLPLFCVDQRVNKPYLVGIHVAGNNKSTGMSALIDRESVVLAYEALCPAIITVQADFQDPKLLVVGLVEKLRTPINNQVIPSPLHQSWGPSEYGPSVLKKFTKDGKVIDPWVVSRATYSRH